MIRPNPDQYDFPQLNDDFFEEKVALVESLMFPLRENHANFFEEINWELFDIWKNICHKYMIDHEYRYIYFDYIHSYENQEPWEDEIEEVRRAKMNAESWVESAKTEMINLCTPLYSKIADREAYPKHYPRFNESNESMRKRSKSKDAVLLPEYTIAKQNFLFVKLLQLRFPIILTNRNLVFIIERNILTGYSEGKECSKLVCKIDTTSKLVHFYPIHNDEVFKYKKEYKNPVTINPLFYLEEFDDNDHIRADVLKNFVEIID